jgi:hypothetical protein
MCLGSVPAVLAADLDHRLPRLRFPQYPQDFFFAVSALPHPSFSSPSLQRTTEVANSQLLLGLVFGFWVIITVLCAACLVSWSVDGKYLVVQLGLPNYIKSIFCLPVIVERGLPELPPQGLRGPEDIRKPRQQMLPRRVNSVLGPEKYSYTIASIRRNIYRIPLS